MRGSRVRKPAFFTAGRSSGHLGGIDDDHMVAGVAVGGVGRLVLAAQNRGDLAGQAAERHAVGVNNIPLALDGLGICHKRFHVNSSIILKIRI